MHCVDNTGGYVKYAFGVGWGPKTGFLGRACEKKVNP